MWNKHITNPPRDSAVIGLEAINADLIVPYTGTLYISGVNRNPEDSSIGMSAGWGSTTIWLEPTAKTLLKTAVSPTAVIMFCDIVDYPYNSAVIDVYMDIDAPTITSSGTATATVGVPFSYQIEATNMEGAVAEGGSYAMTGSTGLSCNASTGLITGTAPTAGSVTITVSATNPTGTGSKQVTITVAAGVPTVTSSGTATATVGVPFSYQIEATNMEGSGVTYSMTGSAGLSCNTSTGLITGTASTAGSITITVSATNETGTGSKQVTITVSASSTGGGGDTGGGDTGGGDTGGGGTTGGGTTGGGTTGGGTTGGSTGSTATAGNTLQQPTSDPLFILYPYNAPTDGTDWGFYPLSYWHPSMAGIVGAFSPDDVHAPVSNIDEAVVDAALDVYMPMAEVSLDTWCHWMYNVKKVKLTIHSSVSGVPDVIYHGVQGALSSRDANPFQIANFTEFSQYPVPDAMQYTEDTTTVAAGGVKVYWWKQDGSTSEGTSRGPDWLQFVHRGIPYIGLQYQSSVVEDSTAIADYNSIVVSLNLGGYTLTYTYEVEATFY